MVTQEKMDLKSLFVILKLNNLWNLFGQLKLQLESKLVFLLDSEQETVSDSKPVYVCMDMN